MSTVIDGDVLHRTPLKTRILLIILVLADAALLEAILQPLRVIPAVLQAVIVVLVVGLVVGGLTVAFSFCTVRGGPGWIAVHRGRWHRITAGQITGVYPLGFTPAFASLRLQGRGTGVRVGTLALRSPIVRSQLREVIGDVVVIGGISVPTPVRLMLGLPVGPDLDPTDLSAAVAIVARSAVVAAIGFVVRIRWASPGSWWPPIAMGVALGLVTAAFFAWIIGPRLWRTMPTNGLERSA